MKVAWATDIHLDHAPKEAQDRFFDELSQANMDLLIISGDISTGKHIERDLSLIGRKYHQPVLFCLGNHDHWKKTISQVRKTVSDFCRENPQFIYLTENQTFPISSNTAIIGHNGFYDARFGNPYGDRNMLCELNDFQDIRDLKPLSNIYLRKLLIEKLNKLGDEAAQYFEKLIPDAFLIYEKLVIVTHVPPFEEACLFHGQPTDPNFLPFYSCKAIGDILLREIEMRPMKEILVLSGHTHNEADVLIRSNLRVRVGQAEYKRPRFDIIEL